MSKTLTSYILRETAVATFDVAKHRNVASMPGLENGLMLVWIHGYMSCKPRKNKVKEICKLTKKG